MNASKDIPIFMVSCRRDKERRAAALASCAGFGASVHLIDAVDARDGVSVFVPFVDLIGPDFWLKDQAKPGAVACFLSHRIAWEALVQSGEAQGLIMEDDSRLRRDLKPGPDVDIYWVNDRMLAWSLPDKSSDIGKVIKDNFAAGVEFASGLPKAPGADGYILSAEAAQKLLRQSEIDKIRCGVDWYMISLVMGAGLASVPWRAGSEPDMLAQMFAGDRSEISGAIAPTPVIKNDRHWGSSIGHSKLLDILDLKAGDD